MPTPEERVGYLAIAISQSLKLLDDYGLLKDIMGDERYAAAIHNLRGALRRERCFTLPAGAEVEMMMAVCVSRREGGSRVVPLRTRLRFTGEFDERNRMECEVIKVPPHKNDMSSPVVKVGESVWILPDWCKVV